MMRMSVCFRSTFSVVCPATGLSKWMKNLFLRLLLLYAVPDVKAAVMRLFEDDPQGYTKRLDTAFSVQNIVEELHYQHSDEAVRTVLNDMSGRADPFVEQRDEGGSDDYYLKRGGGGGAEGGVAEE